METLIPRPIRGLPVTSWAAAQALPTVCRLAWLVDATPFFDNPAPLRIDMVVVRKVDRVGGYVIYRHWDAHRWRFDSDNIAPFADVHSELPAAVRHAVERMKEMRAAAEAALVARAKNEPDELQK